MEAAQALSVETQYMIRISDDKMEAYISRRFLKDETAEDTGEASYSEKTAEEETRQIVSFLEENKVVFGILPENIKKFAADPLKVETLAAEGTCPTEGRDGFYTWHFNTSPQKKPIILEDGSVDYNTLGQIELCREGSLLAEYHDAVPGEEGMNVFGFPVIPPPVKELRPLKGKGFVLSEAGKEYYAAYDGKVELGEGNLVVSRVFLVNGDVDAVTGDISFNGDIIVRGNVYSGVTVDAAGNITVDGHVEIASLKAGKSVIIKKGMQGAGKGLIKAKGDVSASFLEQVSVQAGGSVNANTILNCDIISGREVIVSGKRGAIVGGETRAIERISAMTIGNKAETLTRVYAGLNKDFQLSRLELETAIEELVREQRKIGKEYKKIMEKLSQAPKSVTNENKMSVFRRKILNETALKEKRGAMKSLLDQRQRSEHAGIIALGRVYPRVDIMINRASLLLRVECKNVNFTEETGEIHIYTNGTGEQVMM